MTARVRPRVAGRDRLGYRRHGLPKTPCELIGHAMGVPAWAVRAGRARRWLPRVASRPRR